MENTNGQQVSQSASPGTPAVTTTPTSASNGQNVVNAPTSVTKDTVTYVPVPSDKDQAAPTNITDSQLSKTPSENDFEALKGKVSTIEKENAQLKKEKESLATEMAKSKNLQSVVNIYDEALKDPTVFKSFATKWKEKTGKDLGTYEQYFGATSIQATEPGSVQPGGAKILTADEIREISRNEVNMVSENARIISKVYQLNPEVDPGKITDPAEKEKKKVIFERAAKIAFTNKEYFPNTDMADLISHYIKVDPENINNLQAQAELNGEIKGRQNALLAGTGVSAGVQGGGSRTIGGEVQVKMTAGQMERYNQLQQRDPERAKKYLQQVANPM